MNIFKHFVLRGWLVLALLILVSVSLVWAATPHCPSGYTLTSDYTKCVREQPRTVCPENYTLSGSYCRKTERTASICPDGTSYNSTLKQCAAFIQANVSCPSGAEYDSTSGKCVSDPIISCPSGYHRSGTRTCQRTETSDCPYGFTLSTNSDYCYIIRSVAPTCPTGSTYNSSKHVCEDFANPTCPANHRMLNGQCVQRTQYQ